MKTISDYLLSTAEFLSASASSGLDERVERAVEVIATALRANLPLLVCGNGGSAADAAHIAGELVGRFLKNRKAYRVLSLAADPCILTAWSNDCGFEEVFARQVEAHGEAGGVILGISTSGNSANVIRALASAKASGMTTLALTGAGGGKMAELADILLDLPSTFTPMIQQGHVCLYHYLCQRVEEACTEG